jgi:hypothetical protein
LHIKYTLHQVCDSIFINQTWIEYLKSSFGSDFDSYDFRSTGSNAFQAMGIFCNLINQTISDQLIQFNSRKYVSTSVISLNIFEPEMKSLIHQFRSSMTNNFLVSLATIRDTTQSNALFSALQTNSFVNVEHANNAVNFALLTYRDCSCAISS